MFKISGAKVQKKLVTAKRFWKILCKQSVLLGRANAIRPKIKAIPQTATLLSATFVPVPAWVIYETIILSFEGAGADDAVVLNPELAHCGLHIFLFHCLLSFTLFINILFAVEDIDTALRLTVEAAAIEVIIVLGAIVVDGVHHGLIDARHVVIVETCVECPGCC